MNTEAIFNAAHSTAIRLLESGAFVSPADTVCSIESGSGRIYTGISRSDMNALIHAEVDAVRNMQAAGEYVIRALLLIGTQSRTPMLPCNNCLGFILSLAPDNMNCMILMSDRMININEVGMFAAPMSSGPEPQNFNIPPVTQRPQYSAYASATPVQNAASVPVQPVSAPAEEMAEPIEEEPEKEPVKSVNTTEIHEVSATVEADTVNSSGDILKGRVKNLLRAADDDTDEFLNSLPSPKRRFGFFKKF
jgi:cytidine deaminase